MVVLETAAIIGIVGWTASPVINRLIGKVQSYAVKKYKWQKGLPEKLESVAHFLDEIGSTVSLVDARGINDPNMMCWLSQLKGAIDEVGDFFDILDYEILKSNQLEDPAAEPGTRLIGSDESSDRLKKLVKKLGDIRQSSRGLVHASMLAVTAGCSDGRSGTTSRPVTGPSLPQEPLGYDDQYNRLLRRLLPPDLKKLEEDSVYDGRAVVAIVGHGGMGKTTLAQRACNDPRVKDKFGLVIWAWVYNKFSESDLLDEIWRSVVKEAETTSTAPARHGEMSFSSIQQALEKLMGSKKYLLVLDDVCNDERATDLQRRETWSNVLAPFRRGDRGSRVLVTTRAMICAQTLGADSSRRIILDGMDHEAFKFLVKRTATLGSARELDKVLGSLASAGKRSPLSAKEIGLKLRNTSKSKWGETLMTDCHESVISAHVSCYQQLPPHLQYCLAFLGLFPNNFEFQPEMLVKMWVAHGFISDDGLEDGNTMEDTASGYLNDLLSRSFLQEIKKDGTITHYVIHEQIHSMIRSVSANYFLMIQRIDSAAKRIPKIVRHLSVTTGCLGCLAQLMKHSSVLKRLRTFLVFPSASGKPCDACAHRNLKKKKDSSASLTATAKDLLRELNGVRVLDLTGTDIADLPPEIGNLIHLRYLALPDTLQKWPEEFSKLLHLQALIGSNDAQTTEVNDRKKLDLSFKFRATETGLTQLAGMNSLRGSLSITGLDAVANKKDAEKAQLRKKKSVKVLKFEWDAKDGIPPQHLDVLEALQPHDGIQVLHIRRYPGTSSPKWLANNCLKQLTRLHIINCRNWVVLPAFGHLPRLNHLHIQEMKSVERIDGSGPFKSLETLVLSDMQNLAEWTAGLTDSGFTTIKRIEILHCQKLERPPPMPSTMESIKVRNSQLLKPILERASKEGLYQAVQLDLDF